MQFDFQFGKCFICNDDCGMEQACSQCMRKLSYGEVIASVVPSDTKEPVCSYCNQISPLVEGTYEFGIRYCSTHKSKAQEDMVKYLIANKLVFIDDVKVKFPEIYSILVNGIPIRRSNGKLDSNWKLNKKKMISKNEEFGWVINFYKLDSSLNKIYKNIPVSMLLDDMAYSSFFKYLIERLISKLENGFYI